MGGMRDRSTGIKCFAVLAALLVLAGCQNFDAHLRTPSSKLGQSLDVYSYDNNHLCYGAIKTNSPVWEVDPYYQDWIEQVKSRGLTEKKCARLTGRFTEAQISSASSKINVLAAPSYNPSPRNLSSESRPYICTSAINEKSLRWETGEIWQGHVNEAKRRGLTELKCSRVARYINDTQNARQSGNANQIRLEGRKPFNAKPCPDTYNRVTWTNCNGTRILRQGGTYTGHFVNGKADGGGSVYYINGDTYVGLQTGGAKTKGTYTYRDGRIYVGKFMNNNFHGEGIFTKATTSSSGIRVENKYIGRWRNNRWNGPGTLTIISTHPNGGWGRSKYVGEWRKGKRNGHGTFTEYSSVRGKGDTYVGEWKDNQQHGKGRFTTGHGNKYVGEFVDGKFQGQGAYTYIDGSRYVGEWKDSQYHGQGTYTHSNGKIEVGVWEFGNILPAKKTPSTIVARKSLPSKKPTPQTKPRSPKSKRKSSSTGSGFFISKLGHIITNQHVINNCQSVTVGDNANKQVAVGILETDERNDLALLRISSTKIASKESKSLIRKLGIQVIPLVSEGLLRSEKIELGEDVLVSGFPFGDIFSNTIKVTKGIVSANRGPGDDSGQFQIDAAVQPGNSGGPIYDENGNIVGVVVAQLNKLKMAKAIGSLPENVNFGIKASTVRQFLTSSGLPTKWSDRSTKMSTKEIAKIAKNQTVMVVCHR